MQPTVQLRQLYDKTTPQKKTRPEKFKKLKITIPEKNAAAALEIFMQYKKNAQQMQKK